MGKYDRAPYTHDLYPGANDWHEDSVRANVLEEIFRNLCRIYGYGEVRTPVFEETELFTRTIGEGTDIVSKEMYTFTDRGGRSMTLRPEGTAPTIRAYLDSTLPSRGGVAKMFYIASIFRYERGQKGRYRQHQQFGVEALGADDPALDAEVVQIALSFFRTIGMRNLTLKLNSVGSTESRAAYLAALKAYVEPFLSEFSDEGKARFERNPLRMLDTKSERELKILANAPHLSEYLSPEEKEHFEAVCGYLNAASVEYVLDPYLVRGFDYYTKTAFEIQSPDLGAQNAVGGGGRYNKLVEEIGGKPTPGIGFGLGTERALLALQALGVEMPLPPGPTAFFVTLGDAGRTAAVKLLSDLRNAGVAADIDYTGRTMKTQMRAATLVNAQYALILGDDEVASQTVQVKDLAAREQRAVAFSDLVAELSSSAPGTP
ncbi:histidine--tRNA ligase [Capsulimonas corticalis]|uniref:Histidine--tRNA ligase n=1 Tax=Capsulimonas corticalis TaxID=2219043 RepID=A0A402CSY3_9BACT|nr:histidine--tRNA ligase [Capsulimonas corticalis]BDI30935.1 histidine--tRNA ligase [Capsulimonas corticalis]